MGLPPTRILLIEDQETDYILTRRMLSSIQGQFFEVEWAPSLDRGREAIRRGEHDVCLLDYRLNGDDGLELLKECQGAECKAPIILLTGSADHNLDVEAVKLGASDFLIKDQLTPALLERSIRHAITQALTLEELRRQQNEIRASELRFRSVVQSAADAIILADEDARILFWNKGAETMFGYHEDEVLGYPLELLMPEQYREAHRRGFERFRVGGKSQMVGKTVELEGLRKDGAVFPLELSLASWRTEEGTFFTGIVRDITERKRADEMRFAKEAAEEANRIKTSFVANISHDLRTPLNAIIGFTNVLLKNKTGNLYAQDVDFLERILLNAKDQLGLIDCILDISKVETGRIDLELGPVSLDRVVREVVKQLEGERGAASVEIVLALPEKVAPIATDAAKLKQVLINLIDNALKFTERGSVTVRVVTRSSDQSPVRIDVIDTGIGIPLDRQRDIFQPFRQAGPGFGGTGLGLSISHSLCDLLGYSLQVQSQPGRGSTFSIVLRAEETRLPLTA